MKKAYIVTVYNHIEYANRFIKQLLFDETSDVWVHIDKNHEELVKCIIENPKVHLVKNNQSVEWGGVFLPKGFACVMAASCGVWRV